MVILFVLAACLLVQSFGYNNFKVCNDAQIAFDGFELSNNTNIARKEKRIFFETADCNDDGIISEDEFSCKWQHSGVDMTPFFDLLDGSDNDRKISHTNYQDFLQQFDLNGNGRISSEEFVKSWIVMILDNDITIQNLPAEPDFSNFISTTDPPIAE